MRVRSCIFSLLLFAIIATITTTAQAVTYTGSYNGSYNPASTTPPSGQDTWVVRGSISPTPNAATGIADFSDYSSGIGDYVAITRNRDGIGENIVFTEDQSNDTYTITTRLKIGSDGTCDPTYPTGGYGIGFGMYNENNGTSLGKMMWLNLYNGGPYTYGTGGTATNGIWLAGGGRCDPNEGAIKITDTNYFDDQWHTFTLEKYLDAYDDAKVRVLVDGSQIGSTLDYESIPDAFYDGAGIGYSSSSYSTGSVEMDYLEYDITTTPEVTPPPTRTEIGFPDISGYQTLVCDFHTHTYYSDGWVMPEDRVDEAYRTGLDAVAITDHIEYKRATAATLPGSDSENTGGDLAIAAAEQYEEVLAIKGTEVTRNVPNVSGDPYLSPYDGHYISLFLDDVDALDINEDPAYAGASEEMKIFAAAVESQNQGGFFAWAHHNLSTEANWVSEVDNWTSFQDNLMANGLLQGLEIGNNGTYFPLAHQWCLDKGLTMLGNSDIHQADTRDANTSDDHRTSTLVFAEEHTTASIQEALEAGRTAVWLNENIIGLEVYLAPLFDESVEIEQVSISESEVQFEITNSGPVDLQLTRTGSLGPANLELAAGSVTTLTFAITGSEEELLLDYIVDNFLIAPEVGMSVSIVLAITPEPIAGDANGDGRVDGSDVTILANNWQAGVDDPDPSSITWAMGDFNGDGRVDGSDVTILANNWQVGVTAATASVPEPSILLLIVSAISLFLIGKGRIHIRDLR